MLDLLARKVFINIELKVPHDHEVKRRYDWRKLARFLCEHISKNGLSPNEYCVSSFDHDLLQEINRIADSNN